MKKQYISPVFTIAAMILLLISGIISKNGFDWLVILAIAVILASVLGIVLELKKPK